jgi:hypothetical protein
MNFGMNFSILVVVRWAFGPAKRERREAFRRFSSSAAPLAPGKVSYRQI